MYTYPCSLVYLVHTKVHMYMCTSSKVVLVANVVDVGTVLRTTYYMNVHMYLLKVEKKKSCVCAIDCTPFIPQTLTSFGLTTLSVAHSPWHHCLSPPPPPLGPTRAVVA